jgi:transcriptional regulator with GAF, ATPase, and Fis domain
VSEVVPAEGIAGIVGRSPAMEEVVRLVRRVAPTDSTVLIVGESGTGKEVVARAIHELSPRRGRPFLACDCSTLAPTLLESELFGHVKGCFSGAYATKRGLLEVASSGTLLLDEVANLGLETQAKLLRVLETRRVRRVGDTVEHEVDLRLIAASNRDLKQMAQEGRFREDLYYRLNVVPILLPPLRDRHGDVALLARTFLDRIGRSAPVRPRDFAPAALAALESYPWPGNVRELRNIVERLAIFCEVEQVEVGHLPTELKPEAARQVEAPIPSSWAEFRVLKRRTVDAVISDLERRFLSEALARSGGNVSRAAELVGMQRTNFHALLRKHGLGSSSS